MTTVTKMTDDNGIIIIQYVLLFLADAVTAYKRSRQPAQPQNAAYSVNNNDRKSDHVVKSVVRIH